MIADFTNSPGDRGSQAIAEKLKLGSAWDSEAMNVQPCDTTSRNLGLKDRKKQPRPEQRNGRCMYELM